MELILLEENDLPKPHSPWVGKTFQFGEDTYICPRYGLRDRPNAIAYVQIYMKVKNMYFRVHQDLKPDELPLNEPLKENSFKKYKDMIMYERQALEEQATKAVLEATLSEEGA